MPCHCSTLLSTRVPLVLSPRHREHLPLGCPHGRGCRATPGDFCPQAHTGMLWLGGEVDPKPISGYFLLYIPKGSPFAVALVSW